MSFNTTLIIIIKLYQASEGQTKSNVFCLVQKETISSGHYSIIDCSLVMCFRVIQDSEERREDIRYRRLHNKTGFKYLIKYFCCHLKDNNRKPLTRRVIGKT